MLPFIMDMNPYAMKNMFRDVYLRNDSMLTLNIRAGANESKKKQETKRFSTFAVSRLRHSETKKKHCLIRESSF